MIYNKPLCCVCKLQKMTVFKQAVILFFTLSAHVFKKLDFHIRNSSGREGEKLELFVISGVQAVTATQIMLYLPSLHHQPMSRMNLAATDDLQWWLTNQCTLWSKLCCQYRGGKKVLCKKRKEITIPGG